MLRRARIWFGLAMLCIGSPAIGDSWTIKAGKTVHRFAAGFKVIVVNESARTPMAPRYYVRIKQGLRTIAHLEGLGFEVLAASPDERLFVGISNSGFPGTAAVVFDRQGNVLWERRHQGGFGMYPVLRYCQRSITRARVWFDDERPELQFGASGTPDSITLRGCDGNRIHLVREFEEGVLRAQRAEEEERQWLDRFMDDLLEKQSNQAAPAPKP
jgi:hypothetical protein